MVQQFNRNEGSDDNNEKKSVNLSNVLNVLHLIPS